MKRPRLSAEEIRQRETDARRFLNSYKVLRVARASSFAQDQASAAWAKLARAVNAHTAALYAAQPAVSL